LYWYQGAHRVVASEYLSKLYLMIDALRYHRSDAALVRVIVPIANNNRDQTEGTAIEFIQQAYAPLKEQMWR
jgi:EpsI family protein